MKIVYTLLIFSIVSLVQNFVQAQAWERSSRVLALGIGASRFYHIDNDYGGNSRNWYYVLTGQINFQGEFGIHEFVGLGFTTGLGAGRRLLGLERSRIWWC